MQNAMNNGKSKTGNNGKFVKISGDIWKGIYDQLWPWTWGIHMKPKATTRVGKR